MIWLLLLPVAYVALGVVVLVLIRPLLVAAARADEQAHNDRVTAASTTNPSN